MILGNVCTRRCGFCAVQKGGPLAVDYDEPARVAEACEAMGLRYAVVTSVNRDDRKDGGAELFRMTIDAIRARIPGCKVEVLVPDFQGSHAAMELVMRPHPPDVLNHNTETVPRLYKHTRPQGNYDRSLELIRQTRALAPSVYTKSGLMVGLGESSDEILAVMQDLRDAGCDILTIGQYLQPSQKHLALQEFVHPDQFEQWRIAGEKMGFLQVVSSPLTRSSYHAEQVQALMQLYPR